MPNPGILLLDVAFCRTLEIQWGWGRVGRVEQDHWAEEGGGSLSSPLSSLQGPPSLSPGPPRDMQPTMKFVMDTSKYWFKPSITREQGKSKHGVSRAEDET